MEQLPIDFVREIQTLLGREEFDRLASALQLETSVSIRVNAFKGFALGDPERELSERVPWSPSGFYLKDRPAFTFDPLFHAGGYYVQEASSMFIGQVIRQYILQPVVALDLCAAPGGKSTHIRSLLPEGSTLVCNEVIRSRSQVLAENMIKWGHPGVVVTNNDPSGFSDLEHCFDLIFTDVPCSGEGMFRKDPGAIREWSLENVNLCRLRQRRIIAEIWDCLKPGGILVYSTCTFNKEENEENIAWIMEEYGAQPLPLDCLPEWGITNNLTDQKFPVYRFLPHKTKGEGFFIAALRKPEGDLEIQWNLRSKPAKKQLKQPEVSLTCKSWLKNPERFFYRCQESTVVAIPGYAEELFRKLELKLKIVHAGVVLAEIKGKDLIPDHSAAMSAELDKSAFPVARIDYDQAIAYLRKETIVLENEIPRGYVLLMYKDAPLGFVKNLGNRANNLYPQEWRIRSSYNSPSIPEVVRKEPN